MKNFMQISFENQNILITGGTKGIGKKLVQEIKISKVIDISMLISIKKIKWMFFLRKFQK